MYCTLLTVFALNIVVITAAKTCQPGQHGTNCDRNCSCNCALYKEVKHCGKSDGECSEGCNPGWYGDQCDQPCSENCVDHICNQHNGHCSKACPGTLRGDYCNITAPLHNCNHNSDDHKVRCEECSPDTILVVLLAITGTAAIVFLILFVTFFVKYRSITTQPQPAESIGLTS